MEIDSLQLALAVDLTTSKNVEGFDLLLDVGIQL